MERGEQPGLQAERTGLSWERSAVAALVGALLLLRHLTGWTAAFAPAAFGLVLALGIAVIGTRRARRIRSQAGAVPVPWWPILISGGGAALFGLVVFVVMAFSTPG